MVLGMMHTTRWNGIGFYVHYLIRIVLLYTYEWYHTRIPDVRKKYIYRFDMFTKMNQAHEIKRSTTLSHQHKILQLIRQ